MRRLHQLVQQVQRKESKQGILARSDFIRLQRQRVLQNFKFLQVRLIVCIAGRLDRGLGLIDKLFNFLALLLVIVIGRF